MSKKRIGIDAICGEYKAIAPILEKFEVDIVNQINRLIGEKNIRLGFPLQSRVKTVESIRDKINSGTVKVKKSVTEIQDLVGIRAILLFSRDIESILSILDDNLNVIRKYNTKDRLADDQFGYSSIHCIAKIPDSWLGVPMFGKCGNICIEFQIRTLSQHNWAEFSHKLEYKNEEEFPKDLSRSLSRVSALLETVDLEFDRLLVSKENFEEELAIRAEAEKLTPTNLKHLLEENFPENFRHGNEIYEPVIARLSDANFKKTTDIKGLMKNYISDVVKLDSQICETIIEDGGNSKQINVKGIDYKTERINEIKSGKSFHNLISALALLIRIGREKEIIKEK